MTTNQILLILSALMVTATFLWFGLRSGHARILAVLKERVRLQDEANLRLQEALRELEAEKNRLLTALASVNQKYQAAEEKMEERKRELEKLGEQFRFEFKNLAQSILDEKTEKFTKLNEEKMNLILGPLKTQLVDFRQKVEETYDKESKERFSLGREVQRLIEMSRQVSQEANNLTTALKGNNKMQGNWGEMILENLLEHSGLRKGSEYFLQEFLRDNAGNMIKDEYGKGLQPDVMIYYPDQRKVIIDSKVSLLAWEQYSSCEDQELQKVFLSDHIRSIRSHIDGLSRKNYPRYAGALDFVLLFMPIEPAFLESLRTDLQLWKYAYDRSILLVSPTNLFAVLKIIADLWKVDQQNKHSHEIAAKAGALYDKFTVFVENLELVGKKLNEAGSVYDLAFKQMSTGRGNLIGRAEELKRMGARAEKQLPERLLLDAQTD